MIVARAYKIILYFVYILILYFFIGLLACNIPILLIGMLFGIPSVAIGAVVLALLRTLEMYIEGDCEIDYQESIRAVCYLAIIYGIYICLYSLWRVLYLGF
ncbi:unnamed protein product [Commensalibacter communis]|uniref:hypothetical protein n=1 Tax=Commensalibacter communis TaxID=2972786 RepID=UPI0022FFC2D0|nr:hypothetical protein [Commensalibacter communis]CAI3937882.1 unnamed protein product [Commensalibacter communis]CAI3939108.1 unnamed protein product [Commensalibacter communis]